MWSKPLKTKDGPEVTKAYRELFEEVKEKGLPLPRELNTDLEKAYRSKEFQDMLTDSEVMHRPKTGNRRETWETPRSWTA